MTTHPKQGEIPHGTIIGRGSGLIAAPVWNYHDHFDAEADRQAFLALAAKERKRPNSKLTEDQINQAVEMYQGGMSLREVGEKFGLRQQSMNGLLGRRIQLRTRSEARKLAAQKLREAA